MSSVRRSLAYSLIERYLGRAIFLVASMILARLLTPAEFGVFALGAAFYAAAASLREFGIGMYVVQEKELTEPRLRAAFGMILAIAWGLGAVLAASGGAVAAFYGEPRLEGILLVVALSFAVSPFGTICQALFQRKMRFRALMLVGLGGVLSQAIVGVLLAHLGFGPLSLAWAMVAQTAAGAAIAYAIEPAQLRLMPSFAEWRRVFSFGAFSTLGNLLDTMSAVAPATIVGKSLGFAPLGLLDRSKSLIAQFRLTAFAAISRVALSAIAQRRREGRDVGPFVLEVMSHATAVAWPFYAVAGVLAEPIVVTLFGSQWTASAPLIQILCVGGVVDSVKQLNAHVFKAVGAPSRHMQVELVEFPAVALFVSVAASYGLTQVAWAIVAAQILAATVSTMLFGRTTGTPLRSVALACYPSLVLAAAAAASAAAAAAAVASVGPSGLAIQMAVGGVAAGAGWVAAVFVVRHPIAREVAGAWRAARRALGI